MSVRGKTTVYTISFCACHSSSFQIRYLLFHFHTVLFDFPFSSLPIHAFLISTFPYSTSPFSAFYLLLFIINFSCLLLTIPHSIFSSGACYNNQIKHNIEFGVGYRDAGALCTGNLGLCKNIALGSLSHHLWKSVKDSGERALPCGCVSDAWEGKEAIWAKKSTCRCTELFEVEWKKSGGQISQSPVANPMEFAIQAIDCSFTANIVISKFHILREIWKSCIHGLSHGTRDFADHSENQVHMRT